MKFHFRSDAVAQELVLSYKAYLLLHALKQQLQLLYTKRLGDVVISAKAHGLHRGFNGAVPGHDGDLAARKQLFEPGKKLKPGHVGHHEVTKNNVGCGRFQAGECSFGAFCLVALKSQHSAYSHAQLANALVIVNDQEPDSQVIGHFCSGLPKSLSTVAMSSWTRNGFSM